MEAKLETLNLTSTWQQGGGAHAPLSFTACKEKLAKTESLKKIQSLRM